MLYIYIYIHVWNHTYTCEGSPHDSAGHWLWASLSAGTAANVERQWLVGLGGSEPWSQNTCRTHQ